jgi:hypothetical protein
MERTKRRKWRWFVRFILIVGLTLAGIWAGRPRERLLMAVARPIMKLGRTREQFCWASDHQLLIVTTKPLPSQDSESNPTDADWQISVDLLDTKTHSRTPLDALTERIKRSGVSRMTGPAGIEVSPDGTWVQWGAYVRGAEWVSPRVARLDGSHYRAWNRSLFEDDFYPDARHVVQLTAGDPVMVVRDLLDPTQDRSFRTLAEARAALMPYAALHPDYLYVPFPRDDAPAGVGVLETYRTEDRAEFILYGMKSPHPRQTRRLKLPEGAKLLMNNPSLQQQSVYWHLQVRDVPPHPFLDWLHRIFPRFGSKPTDEEGLWVSRADGGGMREIGHVPLDIVRQVNGKGVPAPSFEEFQWLPDGKQISFVYHATLYVVPAEPER